MAEQPIAYVSLGIPAELIAEDALLDLFNDVRRIADALDVLAIPAREQALTTAFDRGERRRERRRQLVGAIAGYRVHLREKPGDTYYRSLLADVRAQLREFDREG